MGYINYIFFLKIEGAVESLSKEILTIQAKGDKEAAGLLLQKYCVMTKPLKVALKKLENIQIAMAGFSVAAILWKWHCGFPWQAMAAIFHVATMAKAASMVEIAESK
ncbi:Nudix hydrolase 3 [Spatholobus suberectus]|nr:Nudix hydrolase 3 [Spatholobus suberectus]